MDNLAPAISPPSGIGDAKPANRAVLDWIQDVAKLTEPENIFWCDGSEKDRKSTRLNSSHSQISYAGFCLKKQLADYYRAAAVCLVPSRSESFGLVALEAAACGTPVLAAAVGGLPSIVDHDATGFLIKGRD